MQHADRYFDPDPTVRNLARALYEKVRELPLVCPHGHVDPRLLAENALFPDPAELFIIPDHYIFRMLCSQGVPLEKLGIEPRGAPAGGIPVERDRRKIWQLFADHFYLFRGTPTSCWLKQELEEVFGVGEPLNSRTAMSIYDRIAARLTDEAFRPRALFERFRIETLCTTDAATDTLEHHQAIRRSGWRGRVLPTFRPDGVTHLLHAGWSGEVRRLGELTGKDIDSFRAFLSALESRRRFFKSLGATATDHGVSSALTRELSPVEAEAIFQRALAGRASSGDATAFTAHMLLEMARMSCDDGLVMQLHPGSWRNHNTALFERFGPDRGCEIPVAAEFTIGLSELLNKYGSHENFRLVLFTLDESTWSRELAPLAGHYPSITLGPPWWFFDSIEGMRRFRRAVTETAGIYNTAGFNDDTRAFLSIPARHDLCRRVDANFLAGLVAEHIIELEEAEEMIIDLSGNLARRTYRLPE